MAFNINDQVAPAAATPTTLYTCGASNVAVVNLTICNFGTSSETFTIRRKATAATGDSNEQYLFKDEPIPAKRTYEVTIGITLTENMVLVVESSGGNLAFNASGDESAA